MFADFNLPDIVASSASILLLVLVVALALFFCSNLWKIVGSVGEGDPFVHANARRLRDMALAILAIYPVAVGVVYAMVALSARLDPARPARTVVFDVVDLTGALTAVVLLVLAWVFRIDAVMRQDLEGTV